MGQQVAQVREALHVCGHAHHGNMHGIDSSRASALPWIVTGKQQVIVCVELQAHVHMRD